MKSSSRDNFFSSFYFLQEVQYNTTFYESPAVLVSVHHYYDRKVKSHVPPENNIITAWVEVRNDCIQSKLFLHLELPLLKKNVIK